jgi:hypothetical protein
MRTFEARVVKGRLVVDEPSPYPNGTTVRLVAVDESVTEEDLLKELGRDGLAALKASLKRSHADYKAGRTHALEDVVRDRSRRRTR